MKKTKTVTKFTPKKTVRFYLPVRPGIPSIPVRPGDQSRFGLHIPSVPARPGDQSRVGLQIPRLPVRPGDQSRSRLHIPSVPVRPGDQSRVGLQIQTSDPEVISAASILSNLNSRCHGSSQSNVAPVEERPSTPDTLKISLADGRGVLLTK